MTSLADLAQNYPSPNVYHSLTTRFDYRLTPDSTMFLRYTHDGNAGTGENAAGFNDSSNFTHNVNWADQWALGWTKVINPTLVNDARFGFLYWENNETFPTASECGNPCIGLGLSQVTLLGSNFVAGDNSNTPQNRIARTYDIADVLSKQMGSHRFRFGLNFEWYAQTFNYPYCNPGCYDLEDVEQTKSLLGASLSTYMPNLPNVITDTADLLQLPFYQPVQSGNGSGFGAGPGFMPGYYNFGSARRNFSSNQFYHDTWKVTPRLTVNYGFGWLIESGLTNASLQKAAWEAPIFGLTAAQCGSQGAATCSQLSPTPINNHEIEPTFGFAYSLDKSGKTVLRGGAGEYWDTVGMMDKEQETWYIGPQGNGRVIINSTDFTNIFPGIVQQGPGGTFIPLAIGAPIPGATFTTLTFADMNQIYAQQYPNINANFNLNPPLKNGPYSATNLDITKSGNNLMPGNFSVSRSYQTSIGIQRDLGHDMVLTADWAQRIGENVSTGSLDYSHYSEYVNGVNTPLIPKCSTANNLTPGVICSEGGLAVTTDKIRSIYEGLLVKVQKRLSHNNQFIASYALQNLSSPTVENLNNWNQYFGPKLARQNFNLAGIYALPWGIQASLNSSLISVTPLNITTTGIDITGTGATTATSLPGLPFDCAGISCSKSQLAAAVAAFNTQYAGTIAPNGTKITAYALPPNTPSANRRLHRTYASQRHSLTRNVISSTCISRCLTCSMLPI